MRGSIAAAGAPHAVDLAPSGLLCRAPMPTQGCAALRPGLNYLSPYGLQSAEVRREVANVEINHWSYVIESAATGYAPFRGLPHITD